jgi:6-phospho-beta-glucosidase
MPVTKAVVLGGSSVGTPALIDALQRQQPTQSIDLVLHGRSHDKLDPVAHAAALMAQGMEWLKVSATIDLAEALDGAAYVINQVRVGGLAARAFDETFPIPLGIPGEETVGPGGFANSLRTVPQVVKLVAEIEKYAPDALLLSFTNPASVIQYAVTQTCGVRVVGLCDGPITMIGQAAQALGVDASELTVDYAGMHHFGFITRVLRDGQDVVGQDVTQAMLDCLDQVTGLDMDVDLVRSLSALPTPYFKYFVHADRIIERQRAQMQSRAEQLLAIERDLLAEYAASSERPTGVAKRGAKWYDAIIAPVLMTLIEGRNGRFILNIVNRTTQKWLPADAIIETPCQFEAGQVRPIAMPAPSRELQARIRLNCAYEQAMVEAILEQSEAKALRALLLSPLIPNATVARAILKRIWPDAQPN